MFTVRSRSLSLGLAVLFALLLIVPAAAAPLKAHPSCGQGEGLIQADDLTDPCHVTTVSTVTGEFQGEGLGANTLALEVVRPVVAGESLAPVKAYYVCQAGLGLLAGWAETDPCR